MIEHPLSKFEVKRNALGRWRLLIGLVAIHIDQWGKVAAVSYPFDAGPDERRRAGCVSGRMPSIRQAYRQATGLYRHGTPSSSARHAFLEYTAAALNQAASEGSDNG